MCYWECTTTSFSSSFEPGNRRPPYIFLQDCKTEIITIKVISVSVSTSSCFHRSLYVVLLEISNDQKVEWKEYFQKRRKMLDQQIRDALIFGFNIPYKRMLCLWLPFPFHPFSYSGVIWWHEKYKINNTKETDTSSFGTSVLLWHLCFSSELCVSYLLILSIASHLLVFTCTLV